MILPTGVMPGLERSRLLIRIFPNKVCQHFPVTMCASGNKTVVGNPFSNSAAVGSRGHGTSWRWFKALLH